MKNKSTISLLILAGLNLLISSHNLNAQVNSAEAEIKTEPAQDSPDKLGGYIETNYYRHYLWRGALWGSNDVSQPELHLDYGNFSFALCANLNLVPKNLPKENYKKKVMYDEQDVEFGYQNSVGKLEYQALLSGYFYFNQVDAPGTGEVFTKFQYPVWKNTKVFTETAIDIAAYKGAIYNSTGLVYEKEIKDLAIEFKLFTGYANSKFNNTYYAVNTNALNFTGTSLNLEYSFINNFYIAVKGEYNQYTNKEIRSSTGLKKTDNFSIYFGLEF